MNTTMTTLTKLASLMILGLFLAPLGGCTEGVRAPIEPRMDPYTPAQVHIADPQLRRDTAVGTPVVTRDEAGGLVFVTVPVRSAINKTIYVDYYVTFFDRNGQPIGGKLGPFTKVLQPNTPDSVTVNSTSPRAADFQVDFRYAR